MIKFQEIKLGKDCWFLYLRRGIARGLGRLLLEFLSIVCLVYVVACLLITACLEGCLFVPIEIRQIGRAHV